MKRAALAIAAAIGLTAGAAALTPADAQYFSYSGPGFSFSVGDYPRYYHRHYYYPRPYYSRTYWRTYPRYYYRYGPYPYY